MHTGDVAGLKICRDFSFYLSMHSECDERLLARAEEIGSNELEISLRREDVRIRRMVNSVMGEVHRMKAFVRLSALGPCILFGFLKPRHRIGEVVCDHFARRNAGMIVVVGSGSESWISLCRDGRIWRARGNGLEESLERLKSSLITGECGQDGTGADQVDVDGLWQAYYDSQYCPERKNMAAFRRHMPKRDLESAGLRIVQNKRIATLADFRDG
jgi:probable DNA metabolism protein